jgi:undecaprenyl diphosphate synthase
MLEKLKHIAFIPDGNRRWNKKNKNESNNYDKGFDVMKGIIEYCINSLNISNISFYGLAKNNMKRENYSIYEIVIENYVNEYLLKWKDDKVNFDLYFWGALNEFSLSLYEKLLHINQLSKNHTNKVNVFLNYSFKEEISYYTNFFKNQKDLYNKNESYKYPTLYLSQIDLLIRTGGYHRLSDFCLSLLEYTQICFLDDLWPDFSTLKLDKIIHNIEYQNFGI